MKFISDLKQGDRISDIYLCKYKQSATTKNGKTYDNVILQDRTGSIDAKVWEPNSEGIDEFDSLDYVDIFGEVTSFNGALQLNIKRAQDLLAMIGTVQNQYLKQLLEEFFLQDEAFIKAFRQSSAAKSVHHGFVGGLLEHTLGVTKMCDYFCSVYPVLNRDLLITAAICHDIGKTKELSLFPTNDYTDDGQFLGHIVMGTQMVAEKMHDIDGFPVLLSQELQHCILAHHGEFEYGSPKKPALVEAVALNLADNADARIETFTEVLNRASEPGWQGYNRLFESNLFDTRVEN